MDNDDYPLLMRNAMRDSMLRTRVGALLEDECGSPAGYDTSGSAIRSHSLLAVGSLMDVVFRAIGGVVCRGIAVVSCAVRGGGVRLLGCLRAGLVGMSSPC